MATTKLRAIPEYEKGSLCTSGINFEVGLHTLFALSGIQYFKNNDWRLSNKNKQAGKFGDLVFESDQGNILLQAKITHNKKLSHVNFLSDNPGKAEFNLARYILSFKAIKGFDIKYLILCSNSDVPLSLFCRTDNEIICKIFEDCIIYSINTKNITKLERNVTKFKANTSGGNEKSSWKEIKITREDIELFISKFMFVKISERQVQTQIQEKLKIPLYNFPQSTVEYVVNHVRDWCNIESSKAVYLTNLQMKLFLYGEESRKNSKKLLSRPMLFKNLSGFESHNIIFLKAYQKSNWYLTRVLLTLKQIYKNKLEDTFYNETLFIDEDKDFTTINDVLDSFEVNTLTYLVICFSNLTENQVIVTYKKIKAILSKHLNKKVFIVGRELVLDNYTDVKVIKEQVCFDLLNDVSQCNILNKYLNVQGFKIKLKDAVNIFKEYQFLSTVDESVLTKLSEGEEYTIGRCVNNADITDSLRIRRKLRSETGVFSEQELLTNIIKPFVIIVAPAGAGITTLFRKLLTTLKEQNPLSFVINLDFSKAIGWMENRATDSTLLDVLCNIENIKTPFEVKMFRSLPKVILLDGIDENSYRYIAQLQEEVVSNRHYNISTVILSTRNYDILESLREFQVITLEPLSDKNQLDLLKQQLQFQFTDDSYVNLVETLFQNVTILAADFKNVCQTPLAVKMVTEILIANMDNMRLLADMFSKKLNIYEFYQYFINARKYLFVKEESGSTLENWRMLSENFDGHMNALKILAAKRMFPSDLLSYCNLETCVDLDVTVLQLGVMRTNNHEFRFTHNTFEEYFAAEYIWDKLLSKTRNPDVLLSILNEILLNVQFSGVSDFLEGILDTARITEKETMVEISRVYSSLLDKIEWNETNNLINMAFRRQINIIKLVFEYYEKFNTVINVRGSFNETALHLSAHDPRLVKYFVENGADVNLADENGCTISHYIIMMSWDSDKYATYCTNILGTQKERNHLKCKIFLEQYLRSRYEPQKEQLEGLKYLKTVNVDLNIENNNGDTLVHLAAYGNSVNVLQYLIEDCGADFNVINNFGNTPLDYAAESGSFEALKYLQLKNANLK